MSQRGGKLKPVLHSVDIDERTHWRDLAENPHWVFHRVGSGHDIESILKNIGTIDMFIHDSDHNYGHQLREFEAAWSHLKPGGLLISDDVSWSNAFLDFCGKYNLSPTVLSEAPKVAGAVSKPIRNAESA